MVSNALGNACRYAVESFSLLEIYLKFAKSPGNCLDSVPLFVVNVNAVLYLKDV